MLCSVLVLRFVRMLMAPFQVLKRGPITVLLFVDVRASSGDSKGFFLRMSCMQFHA